MPGSTAYSARVEAADAIQRIRSRLGNDPPLAPMPAKEVAQSPNLMVVDCHTGGETCRVIVKGGPCLVGATIAAQRLHFIEHYDHIRTALLQEPRGNPIANGDMIVPAVSRDASFGCIIMEQNDHYPMRSGHNGMCSSDIHGASQ